MLNRIDIWGLLRWTSTLRGLVELAQTLTKGALNAPGQLQTIYGHREHMLAHGLTGLVCIYKPRTI